MSANILLKDGLIDPALVPASVIPANPVFESVAVVPPAGEVGYLSIENPAGEVLAIQKNADGSAQIFNEMNTALVPIISFGTAPDPNPTVLNITFGNSGIAPGLYLNGNSGNGEVYDSIYNPVLQEQQALGGIGNTFFNTTTTLTTGTFTAPRTGMYVFQTTFSAPDVAKNTIIDNNGLIEWYVEGPTGYGEIVGGSMTVLGSTLNVKASAPLVAAPIDWSFTNFCYLDANIQYSYKIQAFAGATPAGTWAMPTLVSVIAAC